MPSDRRYVRAARIFVVGSVVGILVGYVAMVGTRAARSGLSWREMDFNHDGTTSVGELFDAGDVGTRPVRRHGRVCTEYFLLKDGLPVKVSCPAS